MAAVETAGLGAALGAGKWLIGLLAQSEQDAPGLAKLAASIVMSCAGNAASAKFDALRDAARLDHPDNEVLNHHIEQAYRLAELGALVQFLNRFSRLPGVAEDAYADARHGIRRLSDSYGAARADGPSAFVEGISLDHVAAALSSLETGQWASAEAHAGTLRRQIEDRALGELEIAIERPPSPAFVTAFRSGVSPDLPAWFGLLAHNFVNVLLNKDKREAQESLVLRLVARVAMHADPGAAAARLEQALSGVADEQRRFGRDLEQALTAALVAVGDKLGSSLAAVSAELAGLATYIAEFRAAWQRATDDLQATLLRVEVGQLAAGRDIREIKRIVIDLLDLERSRTPSEAAGSGGSQRRPWSDVDLGHLPPAGGRPFGRDAELARLDAFLADAQHRVLLVCGRSGAGKTTLVAHGVAAFLERPATAAASRPVALIVLRATELDRQLGGEALQAFDRLLLSLDRPPVAGNAQFRGMHEKLEQVGIELTRAGVEVLLVLDSLEAALDPAGADPLDEDLDDLLQRFLEGLPALRLIVTSQVSPRLSMQGQRRTFSATGWPGASEIDLGGGLRDRTASIAWLRACDPDHALGLADAAEATLGALCDAVGHNPNAIKHLALALSADRLLGPEGLLGLLRDQSTQRPEIGAVRDALIGRSYDGLGEPARQLLQAIAVHGGSATLPAIETLLDIPGGAAEPARLLLSRHLVRRDGTGLAIHDAERACYLSRLSDAPNEPRNRSVLFRRAAAWWLQQSTPQAQWHGYADAQPALRAVSLFALAGAAADAARLRVASARRLLEIGHVVAATQCLAQVSDAEQLQPDDLERVVLLATCRAKTGAFDEAQRLCLAALAQDGRSPADEHGLRLRQLHAACELELGRVADAVAAYRALIDESVPQATDRRRQLMLARLHMDLAFAESMRGRIGEAIVQGQRAVDLCAEQPDLPGQRLLLMAQSYLATYLSYREESARSQRLFQEAALLGAQIEAGHELAIAFGLYAEIELVERRVERSLSLAGTALRLEADPDAINGSWCNYLIALALALEPSRLAEAEAYARIACNYTRPLNDPNPRVLLGVLLLRRGRTDEGLAELHAALRAAAVLTAGCAGNWEAHVARGWALLALASAGRAPEASALEAYRAAWTASPHRGHLARIALQLQATAPLLQTAALQPLPALQTLYDQAAPSE